MPRAHPCTEPIYPEGPWRPIHSLGPSISAYPCPGHIHPEEPWEPIYAEGQFLPRAHSSRGSMGAH